MEKYIYNDEKGNKVVGDLFLENSKVKFVGENNILYVDKSIKLIDSSIEFRGNNSIVYLCETVDTLPVDIKVYHNSVVYFGKECWINKGIKIVASEQTNVFFGNDCLISYDTCIRTGDPHLIYDVDSKKRVNLSKSFYVGDHVWIGQHVMMLKNAKIGSGSIIGAMSVVSGKRYESNCVYGGNPIKKIKEGIFFLKPDCHRFTDDEIEANEYSDSTDYIYEGNNGVEYFDFIENKLKELTVSEKIEFLQKITNEDNKNRFAI